MKTVEIFSTPTCVHCGHAKEFFKDHGVQYTEYNVAADAERRQQMVEISGQLGVPVIVIGDNVIVGYNEPKIAELLEIK